MGCFNAPLQNTNTSTKYTCDTGQNRNATQRKLRFAMPTFHHIRSGPSRSRVAHRLTSRYLGSRGAPLGATLTHRCRRHARTPSANVATHTHHTRLASTSCAMPPPHAWWACRAEQLHGCVFLTNRNDDPDQEDPGCPEISQFPGPLTPKVTSRWRFGPLLEPDPPDPPLSSARWKWFLTMLSRAPDLPA